MSYSFGTSAASKTQLKALITFEMAKVIASQPPHVQDCMAVAKAAHALVDAQRDDATSYSCSINGSVSTTNWSDPAAPLTHASASISISCS